MNRLRFEIVKNMTKSIQLLQKNTTIITKTQTHSHAMEDDIIGEEEEEKVTKKESKKNETRRRWHQRK